MMQQSLNPDANKKDIERGIKDGIVKGTRDYLMQYIDLAKSLSNLTLENISNGMSSIWDKINNPKETIDLFVGEMLEFKENMGEAYDKLLGLGTYDKSVGGSYIGTTLGLMVGDPGAKLRAITGGSKISQISEKTLKTIGKLQESYRLRVLAKFKDLTEVQRNRLYTLMQKYDIKNPLNFIHVNHGEWKYINGEKRLQSGLHSMNEVEKLLKNGEIVIRTKTLNGGNNWEEIDYNKYISLPKAQKTNIQVKGSSDSRGWGNIQLKRKYQKTLFPSNWTDEKIAQVIRKTEDNIEDILLEKGVPNKGIPDSYWRENFLDKSDNPINIIESFTINGETIELRLGGKYDINGNIDYTIETIFPN